MRHVVLATLLLLGGVLCNVATATAAEGAAAGKVGPTPWQKWSSGWVRLESDGNMSCLSFDGTHCAWNNSVANPEAISPSEVKPLVCGVAHSKRWEGRNGYNDLMNLSGVRHWCRSGYATLFAKWKDHSIIGTPLWLAETPAGDLMCHSENGRKCTKVLPGETVPPKTAGIHPLVCGAHLKQLTKQTGYDTPGHWCQTPKIDEHFPGRTATSERKSLQANWWISAIEPAMLVRAKVPDGRSLTLRAQAQLSAPVTYQGQLLDQAFFGLEFGEQLRFRLQEAAVTQPDPSWRKPALTGDVMVGFTVTPSGNACFFGAKDNGDSSGPFFADGNLIGSTAGIRDDNGQPILFKQSINPKAPSVIDWRADDGTALEIKEILMLYARYVPVAGDPATKRFIHYARTCDNR